MTDVQELAREIAMRMDPEALLDTADVASFIKCEPRYVSEQFARAPGFPKAIHLPGPDGRRGKPRWRRSDILAWVQSCEEGKKSQGGRPRKTVIF